MMNSAKDSASTPPVPPGLGSRMAKTRLSISTQARALTAERGLAGFTVEELCATVGISRRTFFNYFPTKLDAVFGHAEDGINAEALEKFMAGRPEGIEGISPTLLGDLIELVLDQLRRDEAQVIGAHGFFEAASREPEILAKLVEIGPERMNQFIAQVARREGVPADHPGLVMIVHIIQFTMHQTIQRYMSGTREASLESVFLELMRGTKEIFTQPLGPGAPA